MTRAERRTAALTAALAGALALAGCASSPTTAVNGPSRTEFGPVVTDDAGVSRPLIVRVCRPSGQIGPAPLAVINHGAPPRPDEVPRMQPTSCESEPAQWFTARGYVVVFALRRGFGQSGGAIAEESGSCDAPDYVHAGQEGARDIDATVRWAELLPEVRADRTVVIGQSTGGWAALAYAARPDARAVAVIDMAGGRGGRAFDAPGTYCHPERLVAAAAHFGTAAHIPSLWIYARNDSYFTPDLAERMHDAFARQAAAQGVSGRSEFIETPAFGSEGHQLFYGPGGAAVWGPLFARFLDIAPARVASAEMGRIRVAEIDR